MWNSKACPAWRVICGQGATRGTSLLHAHQTPAPNYGLAVGHRPNSFGRTQIQPARGPPLRRMAIGIALVAAPRVVDGAVLPFAPGPRRLPTTGTGAVQYHHVHCRTVLVPPLPYCQYTCCCTALLATVQCHYTSINDQHELCHVPAESGRSQGGQVIYR